MGVIREGTAAARAALPVSVCRIFVTCPNSGTVPVLGICILRADVDACDCTQKSLHWKLAPGEKSLAAPGTRTRINIAPGVSVGRCTS